MDPDQALRSVASDMGLHCLLRPVSPNTYNEVLRYYGKKKFGEIFFFMIKFIELVIFYAFPAITLQKELHQQYT